MYMYMNPKGNASKKLRPESRTDGFHKITTFSNLQTLFSFLPNFVYELAHLET